MHPGPEIDWSDGGGSALEPGGLCPTHDAGVTRGRLESSWLDASRRDGDRHRLSMGVSTRPMGPAAPGGASGIRKNRESVLSRAATREPVV